MLTFARDLAMQVTVFSELFNYDIEEAKRMTKEKLALEVIDRLKKEYPDAGCTLDYDQAWKLLVSVRLAAQCTMVFWIIYRATDMTIIIAHKPINRSDTIGVII